MPCNAVLPLIAVASAVAMVDSVFFDRRKADRGLLRYYKECMSRRRWKIGFLRAVRGTLDSALAFDLHFREIVEDPVGAIMRLHAHFGLELREEAARGMRAWHAANPQGKHGEHRYAADDYELGRDRIRERFADYLRHYGVERERDA